MTEFSCPPNCWAPCCYNCDVIPELNELDMGNGRCKHLDNNGKCLVYHSRPEICSMELMHKKLHSHLDWDFYCWLSEQTCGQLRKYLAHKKPIDKSKKK